MALPQNTGVILYAAGYDPLVDYIAVQNGGVVTLQWSHTDPEPTEQQITDWSTDAATLPNGQLFSVWYSENGGDPLLTLRRKAKEALDEQQQENHALIRAVVIELLNYCNAQRARHNTLLQWLGTQTTLTNRGQLAAMQLNEATPAQARNAIKTRITNGDADT